MTWRMVPADDRALVPDDPRHERDEHGPDDSVLTQVGVDVGLRLLEHDRGMDDQAPPLLVESAASSSVTVSPTLAKASCTTRLDEARFGILRIRSSKASPRPGAASSRISPAREVNQPLHFGLSTIGGSGRS